MSWWPPLLFTREPGDDQLPSMQSPPVFQRTVSASSSWYEQNVGAVENVADQIMQAYSADISQFVQTQRRNYSAGSVHSHQRHMEMRGLDLDYSMDNGQEIMKFIVRPEGFKGVQNQIELNFDGYISWFPGPYVGDQRPPLNAIYNLYMNGYLIFENIQFDSSITEWTKAYLVLFGPTALRCHSLEDDNNPLANIDINGLSAKKPGAGLTNKIAPARSDIPAYTNAYGGAVPAHKDLPGYFIFDWNNQLNPTEWCYGAAQWDNNYAEPQIIKGIQFFSTLNSPLNIAGFNNVSVEEINQLPASYEEPANYLTAEFYDRGSARPVRVSWTKAAPKGGMILINDRPLCFLSGADPGGGNNYSSLGFDLTPMSIKKQAASPDPPATLGYGPANDYDPNGVNPAFPTSYTAAVAAWQIEYNAWILTEAPIISALRTAESAYYTDIGTEQSTGWTLWAFGLQSQGIVAGTTFLAALVTLEEAITEVNVTGYTAAMDSINLLTAELITITANNPVNAAVHDDMVAAQPGFHTDMATLLTALTNYASMIVNDPPPSLPPIPEASQGKSINKFKYRTFTVSNGVWGFGDWQGG